MSGRVNIHATGLVLGHHGLIIRGPSGAGKSLLALELLAQFEARGHKALLVSDDRVEIAARGKGLVIHAPTSIAGLIELRGRGIVTRPHVASAPLHLVIDLVETLERMLEEEALSTELEGMRLARAPVPRRGVVDPAHQLLLVMEALRQLPATLPRQKNA